MCGITGYTGARPAVDIALQCLKRLEYRGYDSAGVAYPGESNVQVVRSVGKIINLENALAEIDHPAQTAIAHTRWATHGRPSEANAHPHHDCFGRIALVHNGIIENYAQLRAELKSRGHNFSSETDTEVLAHLIEEELSIQLPAYIPARELQSALTGQETYFNSQAPLNLESQVLGLEPIASSIRSALQRVTGSYAIAVVVEDAPDAIFVARKDSPLVIGLGEDENFVASDIAAIMRYTRKVILLQDGDAATITPTSVVITDLGGNEVDRQPMEVTWDDEAAEKGGYPHFMLKEIHEGPRTVRATLQGRLSEDNRVVLPSVSFTPSDWQKFKRFAIVGCGTAYHAGVVAKRLFEHLLRLPVEVNIASEFRYSDPLVDSETLVILISQSGETADTLAAMREAHSKGAASLAVVNVVGSTLAREANACLFTQAGPEIGVCSTKAYLAQLTALALLGLYLAQIAAETSQSGSTDAAKQEAAERSRREFVDALRALPAQIEQCLTRDLDIAALSVSLANQSSFFYLGRGYDYAAALEAALKLKEISYLHAEAYPAGEMKHGPLALVEPGVVVIGFCTQSFTWEKTLSNLKEVKAREGTVVTVLRDGEPAPDCADATIFVPSSLDALMPILTMVPMQLLAYYIARERGCEIDQPRNLAKSVTVE